jgi:hypothetical protein
VSEVGGSVNIEFFSSGYDSKYATTCVRSGRIVQIIGFESASYTYIMHYGNETDDKTPVGRPETNDGQ